jgi:hypothetical protein
MYWLVLIGLLLLTVLLVALMRKFRKTRASRVSYTRNEFLLSQEERQFFSTLNQSVGENYLIFPMLRVEDLITSRDSDAMDRSLDLLEEAHESVIPFVLARKEDLGIACGVQLIQHRGLRSRDTPTPESPLRNLCQAAGLPLIRIESGPFYDLEDIRQAVSEAVRREPLFITESDGRREPTLDRLERLDIH